MNRVALFTLSVLSLGGLLASGCHHSHEVSHEETDKPRLFGGHEHKEKTTYQNDNGTYTTDQTKVKTSD